MHNMACLAPSDRSPACGTSISTLDMRLGEIEDLSQRMMDEGLARRRLERADTRSNGGVHELKGACARKHKPGNG